MAKRKRSITEQVIDRRIKEGRGKGIGRDYKPWLNIQDVPSNGDAHRKTSWTVGRMHQLLSTLELHYLYVFDWSPDVVDIREQYPLLPLKDTLEIAQELGVPHPTDPQTKEAIVMTTDFVITLAGEGDHTNRAITIKPASELQNPRVIEKFEIERLYWQTAGVQWCIGTERDINMIFVDNIKLLHDYLHLQAANLSKGIIEDAIAELTLRVQQPVALVQLTAGCDKRLGLSSGTSLSVAYHLMATRRWQVDMQVLINPSKPIAFLPPSVIGVSHTNGTLPFTTV
jgi:hypothetical protein